MEQVAKVVNVEENRAEVLIVRDSACGSDCGDCRLCEQKEKKDWVINNVGAKAGDIVKVSLKTSSFLGMATFAYIMPVFVAAVLSYTFNFFMPKNYADLFSAIALFVLVGVTVLSGKKLFSGEKYQSQITEIINSKNEQF